jgi:hypothetical protein
MCVFPMEIKPGNGTSPLVLAHDSTYARNETCIVTFHVSMSDYNRVSEKQGLPLRAE